jgi:lysophospholipase L1-like esterase
MTTQIRGLAAGAHTVVVTNVSGLVFISGAFAYNGDEAKGIRTAVAAAPGWGTPNFWPTDSSKRYFAQYVGLRPPDLVTIGLGPNDYGSADPDQKTTVTTYKANIQAMIAEVKVRVSGYVPSFVLMPKWAITGNTPSSPWSSYVTALYEIAATDPDQSVAVFDLQRRVNPGAPSTAGGFLPDTTHPTDPGLRAIGELFTDWLAHA